MAGSIQALIREALDLAKSVVILEKLLVEALDAHEPASLSEHELCSMLAERTRHMKEVFTLYTSADADAMRLRQECAGWGLFLNDRWYVVPRERFEKLLVVWRK